MKPEIRTQLVKALYTAAEAARLADPVEDGGTCNFDSPAIRIPRVKDAEMQAIAKETGIRLHPFNWRGMGKWYWVGTPMSGQGARRTIMMEAALSVLKEQTPESVTVMGYYQMD